jgi:lipopolysaccharide export system protein LptC
MRTGPGFYSRLVAVLKIGLPLLALGLLSSLFLLSTDDDFEGGLVFSESDLEALGQGLRVTGPVLTGRTRGEDPFRFTAEIVIPDAAPPTRATISQLDGQVEFIGGPVVDIEAPDADLDLERQVMALWGRVTVRSDDGYTIVADRMEVDLVSGAMTAEGAVDGRGPMGTIASETMAVVPAAADPDRRVFSFGNGVRLVYDGGDETDQ